MSFTDSGLFDPRNGGASERDRVRSFFHVYDWIPRQRGGRYKYRGEGAIGNIFVATVEIVRDNGNIHTISMGRDKWLGDRVYCTQCVVTSGARNLPSESLPQQQGMQQQQSVAMSFADSRPRDTRNGGASGRHRVRSFFHVCDWTSRQRGGAVHIGGAPMGRSWLPQTLPTSDPSRYQAAGGYDVNGTRSFRWVRETQHPKKRAIGLREDVEERPGLLHATHS